MTDFSAGASVGSASWASKLAERVARTQYDFVRVSIADSERRISDLISSSEHRIRNQLTEVEQNLRRDMRPRRGMSQEMSPSRSVPESGPSFTRSCDTPHESVQEPVAFAADANELSVCSQFVEKHSYRKAAERVFSTVGAQQQRPRRMRRNILPESRNLVSLDEGGTSPTVIFNAAFDKSGGQAAVDQWNEISDSIHQHVADRNLDELVCSILPASQSEGSSSMRRPLHQHYAPDFHTLLTQAAAVLSGFNSRVQGIAARSKGRPIFTALKSEKRASMKGRCRYTCSDRGDIAWYRLTDVVRATISYPDISQMYQGLQVVAEEFGSLVREVRDHYFEPLPCGYRSLQLVVEHDGHLCEVVLNVEAMVAAKEAVGPLTDEARDELLFAVRHGDVHLLRDLLDWIDACSSLDNVLPNLLNEKNDGGTLLHEAAKEGNHEMVQHLLLYAADVNTQDKSGNAALHMALQYGHEQVTWALLDVGRANPRLINSNEMPALMLGLSVLWSHPEKEGVAQAVRTLAYYAGADHVREVLGHLREGGYKLPQDASKELKFDQRVEEVDAASSATSGPKRSVRTRVNTGFEFSQPLAQDARPGLRFDDKTESLDAASAATGGEAKRSIRTRINTGFAFKEQEPAEEPKESKLQFNEAVTELDAASSATEGPSRNIRTRINTGFAFERDNPVEDNRPRLQFTGSAEVLEAASTGTDGPRRSIRDRVNTGFAFEASDNVKVNEPKDRELQFDDRAEQLDAASAATSGAAKSVRARVNTGYLREVDVPKDDSPVKHLEFDDRPVQLDAASSASNNPAKSVRARINTGFVRNGEGVEEEHARLQFDSEVVELDAASAASGSSSKSIRGRINTGFVKDQEIPKAQGLQFNDSVEEVDAASHASGASGRSARSRVNTGYVKDSDMPEDKDRGLQFSDDIEELDAASQISGASGRSVRTRVNTGFVKDGAELEDKHKDLRFTEDVEELDAASCTSGSSGRSVRTRVNTGFIKDSDTVEEKSTGLQFNDDVEQLDAASHASGVSGRPVRSRVNTGFVKDDAAQKETRQGLQFDDEVEHLDAASATSGSSGRSVRTRVNTGFVKQDEASPKERQGLQFDDDVQEVDAASAATGGSTKSVRARVNTGFVKDEDMHIEKHQGLQFAEDVEEVDAASEATGGPGRSVRARVNTGFVKEEDAARPERTALKFDEDVEEFDAASEAAGGARSARTRVNTGFVRDVPNAEQKGLQFDDVVDEVDAASHASGGSGRSVRTRVNTGFVKESDAPAEGQRGIHFQEDAEELDAASSSTTGSKKSVRARVNTGFVKDAQDCTEDKAGIQFSEEVEQLDAASSSTTGSKKSVRARVNTGFVTDAQDCTEDKAGIQFSEEVEQLDAASSSTTGSKKSVRARVNTGFVKDAQDCTEDKAGIQFSEEVEQFDAASSSTSGSTKSVRARVNTGFVNDTQDSTEDHAGIQFSEEVEQLDAASESTGASGRSVRTRVNTGFVKGGDAPAGPRLHFDDDVEECEAASDATSTGRSVRNRVNTGYVKEEEQPELDARREPKSLKFAEDDEEVDAASEATSGETKSVRGRVHTGFVKQDEVPQEQRQGLHFDDKVEELDAASESIDGAGRSVRTRVNTGYVKQQDAPTQQGRGLQFSEDVQEIDAASEVAAAGSSRTVRGRVHTGYAREEAPDAEVGDEDSTQHPVSKRKVLFSSGEEHLEAASAAVEDGQERRSVRERVSTGWEGIPIFSEERRSSAERHAERRASQAQRKCSDGGRSSGKNSVILSEEIEIREAASILLGGDQSMRQIRSRKSTGYSEPGGSDPTDSSDDDDDDGTVSQASSRPSLLQRRLSSRRTSRLASRRLTLEVAGLAAAEKRKMQHMTIFGQTDQLDADSPEIQIDDHLVEGAEKDETLLQKSLRPLALFEDFDDASLLELIEDMNVYEYQDKEEVVRQGDTGGTHFFVVAEGRFEIVKNDKVVVELDRGEPFGESVLLIDGSRTATVRAVGTARVYAMEAEDVRDVLRYTYQMEHKQVMNAIEKILESERCDQFRKLNAYQLHKLYMDAGVQNFEPGEIILNSSGEQPFVARPSLGRNFDDDKATEGCVWVLVQGAIVLRDGGRDLERVQRYTLFGVRFLLFGDAPVSAIADGSTKCLALSKNLLEEVFGVAKMPTVLLGSEVDQALDDAAIGLSDDMREAMAKSFTVQDIGQGNSFDATDVRFVMCLHGDVEVSTDGFASDIRVHQGSKHDIIGLDHLKQQDLKWDIQVRSAYPTSPTWIAVWKSGDVDVTQGKDDAKDKLKILKSVFLFKTLTLTQLRNLAESMSTQHYAADQTIFSQGDMGHTFYIIGSGRVSIEKSGRYIRALSKGDFFGERALLNNEPRSASIIASEPCIIWAITSQTFEEVMPKASLDYLRGRMGLQDTEYTFNDFTMLRVIGTGGFGIVKMVQTKSGTKYALKCVRKQPIVQLEQQEALLNERSILAAIDHPFIIRLVQSFRNEAFVYFLTEIVGGGELLDALAVLGLLDKRQTQFYAASILLAFEHIHERRVAYLDLKSENVLIDYQGYIKLIDFGLAVKIQGGHCHTVKGTPHFMAPEMILGKGYDTMADLWALGICIYEFMLGELPFGNGSSVKSEIFRAVLKAPLVFSDRFRQKPYAEEAMSIIKGLLNHKPNQRLGGGIEGYAGITGHPFFDGVDWDGLIARHVEPPFVPQKEQYSADTPSTNQPQPLAQHEWEEEAKELASGWTDPDPGWDDDFC